MGETVVVGYDGSERSDRALDRAIETVQADGGQLIVVVAEELPPTQNPLLVDLGPYDAGAYGFDPAISLPDLEHPLPARPGGNRPGAEASRRDRRLRRSASGMSAIRPR